MLNKIIKNQRGFVILFATTISGIILIISLGLSRIALQEIKFSTSATDTNNAFFAADTGMECGLFYGSDKTSFPDPTPMNCAGENNISVSAGGIDVNPWDFSIFLNNDPKYSCAKVRVTKTQIIDPAGTKTTITSTGYSENFYGNSTSNCGAKDNSVERELEVNFTQ
ncbi:MAG: hypothetical protein AAB693_00720 [Patescibacteria group bacterium]|mgnify:FL=1